MSEMMRGFRRTSRRGEVGVTLTELLVTVGIFLIGIAAIYLASFGQLTLNEHSRNLSWAVNDANRVIERMRRQNRGCTTPNVGPPVDLPPPDGTGVPFAIWDAWLGSTTLGGGGGKSLPAAANENIFVSPPTGADPEPVTVAVCWQHRGRTIGTCAGPLSAITSPAMLTTSITCRS